jgi:hypothetical protein
MAAVAHDIEPEEGHSEQREEIVRRLNAQMRMPYDPLRGSPIPGSHSSPAKQTPPVSPQEDLTAVSQNPSSAQYILMSLNNSANRWYHILLADGASISVRARVLSDPGG